MFDRFDKHQIIYVRSLNNRRESIPKNYFNFTCFLGNIYKEFSTKHKHLTNYYMIIKTE